MSYTNEQVCHLWANQSKESATSGHGNVFFTGRKLYSYGSHYVLGIILPDGQAILNGRSYSITTAKHQSYAFRALNYSNYFRLPDLTPLADTILTAAGASAYGSKDAARRDLRRFLEGEAHRLSPEAVAYLLRLSGSRANPDSFIAAAAQRHKKAEEAGKRALERQNRESAARTAGTSLDAFRDRLARLSAADEYRAKRELTELAKDLFHEHRAAGGKRIKAAVWERLKMTRAAIDRLERLGPGRRKAREAIRGLRALASGDPQRVSGWTGPFALRRDSVRRTLTGWLKAILTGGPAVSADLSRKLDRALARLDRLEQAARRRDLALTRVRQEREARERFEREQETRRAWLAGESAQHLFRGSDERGGALLRAVGAEASGCEVRAGTLQTSHGAEVPLAHAFRLFRFIKGIRGGPAVGEDNRTGTYTVWEAGAGRPAQIRVGHFTVDYINRRGDFKAGCHLIHWPEIERLATELGLFDCAPETISETEAA
jgi:hypothetical protein